MQHEKSENSRMLKRYCYLMAIAGLTISLYGINGAYKLLTMYKIEACSLFFMLTLAILSAIYQEWGTKKYFQAGAIALVSNATSLLYDWNILDLSSYLSLYPAFFMNWLVLSKFEDKFFIPERLFLGFATAILIDNAILMNGLLAQFSVAAAWQILFRSIGCKFIYSALAVLSVYAINKLFLSTRILKKFSYSKANQ